MSARFKVIWKDGYDRETVAERVLVENLGKADALAICERLRHESKWDGDWWIVKRQDAPVWRGMEEFV